jgi:4-amino-4-deoxy-L-arabinose transferase-like glycosyltransferase
MTNDTLVVQPGVARSAWLLYAAAVASSLPTLWFFLVGEEGILTNSSLEMSQRGDWLRLWLYGINGVHGVFANWLTILISNLVGWQHAPGVVRSIMIGSTAISGLMLAFLVHRLYRNTALAALAAAVAVTLGDILFYRGWLGYRDPLLGMLVFGAIAALWMAADTRRAAWLVATLLFAAMAFLTKGIIAYAFVGVAALVFLWRKDTRSFLLQPVPLVIAAATLCVPFAWAYAVGGDQTHNSRLTAEIADKLMPLGGPAYLKKLITYPLETLLRLAPVSLLVLWWLWRKQGRMTFGHLLEDQNLRTAMIICGVAFVPFWLAPQSHFRYLLPLLPLLALVLAVVLYRLGDAFVGAAMRWMWAAVALKIVLAVLVFPIYQHQVRGENYAITARAVLQHTAGFPLYSHDVSAAGLSVTAYMNIQRLPQRALTFAPAQWDDGFAISNAPDAALGKTAAKYPLGGDTLYLLCRGTACAVPPLR